MLIRKDLSFETHSLKVLHQLTLTSTIWSEEWKWNGFKESNLTFIYHKNVFKTRPNLFPYSTSKSMKSYRKMNPYGIISHQETFLCIVGNFCSAYVSVFNISIHTTDAGRKNKPTNKNPRRKDCVFNRRKIWISFKSFWNIFRNRSTKARFSSDFVNKYLLVQELDSWVPVSSKQTATCTLVASQMDAWGGIGGAYM